MMLREDGIAMDDGTTARFAEDHFVMTTTTANAARVLRHLEFARQCLYPDLDVQAVSVTESRRNSRSRAPVPPSLPQGWMPGRSFQRCLSLHGGARFTVAVVCARACSASRFPANSPTNLPCPLATEMP